MFASSLAVALLCAPSFAHAETCRTGIAPVNVARASG